MPPELGQLGSLKKMLLDYNQLSGGIPAAIGDLSQLQILYLGVNALSGTIPPALGRLAQLEGLVLSSNNVAGTLPSELGDLNQLEVLRLDHNQFSGSIPSSLGQLSCLQTLYLSYNQLNGSIPSALGGLTQLLCLNVESNQLTGSIPSELGNLAAVEKLNLRSNLLSGEIPGSLGQLLQLEQFFLSLNQLTGPIPFELGNLASVQLFDLSGNQLQGSLPESFSRLQAVSSMTLFNNNLSGAIPGVLGQMSSLNSLSLSNNQLTGVLPAALSDIEFLRSLRVSNNRLSGTVPSAFVALEQFYTLEIANNQITGLPNFSAGALTTLMAENNRLGFEDLEPNMAIQTVTYAPQDSVAMDGPSQAGPGDAVTFSVAVGGSANHYAWTRDGVLLAATATPSYTLLSPVSGVYGCAVSNALVPGLVLHSRVKRLTVAAPRAIAISPEQHHFAAVALGEGGEQLFTVFNLGTEGLTLTSISIAGPDSLAFQLEAPNLPLTIAGNSHERLTVRYAPTEAGTHSAVLRICSNGVHRPDLSTPISGACHAADTKAPQLAQAFPAPGTYAVPPNAGFQWKVVDDCALDSASVDVWVDGAPVIQGGAHVSGGRAALQWSMRQGSIQYLPAFPLTPLSTVRVRVQAQDRAGPVHALDSIYVFQVGAGAVTATSADTVSAAGGTVTDDASAVTLEIPANALTDTTTIVISRIENPPALPDTVSGLGLDLHFWPDGLQFNEAVTLSIPYTQALLDSAGVSDPMDLAVYYFSSTTGNWTRLAVVAVSNELLQVEIHELCYLSLGCSPAAQTAVGDGNALAPEQFQLAQNFPNPFNPETHIAFTTAEPGEVSLIVFDVRGKAVRTLKEGQLNAGHHNAVWQGRDDAGNTVSSGVYFYVLRCGSQVLRKKCVFMK